MTTTTKFSLRGWWARRREGSLALELRKCCPPATVAAGQIPPAVRAAWAHQAPDEFPGLAVDSSAWLRCSLGLAQFFEACRLQREVGACALPSKAADSVWHVWLKLDPTGLADWQQRYFGRVVEHREADGLGAPVDECLARTWVAACRSEGRSARAQRLPLVFGVDGQLGLPAGWAYAFERGRLVHRQIDGFGQPGAAAHEHAALTMAGLTALGLLSAAEIEQLQRRRKGSDTSSGGSCGGSWSSLDAGGCDAGGCDAGSDGGGSSCGSSCGGGGGD